MAGGRVVERPFVGHAPPEVGHALGEVGRALSGRCAVPLAVAVLVVGVGVSHLWPVGGSLSGRLWDMHRQKWDMPQPKGDMHRRKWDMHRPKWDTHDARKGTPRRRRRDTRCG